MFECYLLLSYIIIAVVILRYFRKIRSRFNLHVALIISTILVILPVLPYAIVECQTAIYSKSAFLVVRKEMMDINGNADIRFMKILWITPSSMTVYVVMTAIHPPGGTYPEKGYAGERYEFTRKNGKWKCVEVVGLWSDCWRDDGNVFPPYPGKGDYRYGSLRKLSE